MKSKKYTKALNTIDNFLADLRALRKKAGLSQAALARHAGTTQRIISNIETGRYPHPSFDIIQRIIKAL